mmetsp:Transcript_1024/g.2002  ORF Transcript_1024/g.2002 Transcript_1024/m.2002 type:complete len:292 (+) Transcript_1024:1533-2408(+)
MSTSGGAPVRKSAASVGVASCSTRTCPAPAWPSRLPSTPSACWHSSRVGTSTSALIASLVRLALSWRESTFCSTGSAYAIVLPEPVGARATMSLPASASGIIWACTALGSCSSSFRTAFRRRRSKPSDAQLDADALVAAPSLTGSADSPISPPSAPSPSSSSSILSSSSPSPLSSSPLPPPSSVSSSPASPFSSDSASSPSSSWPPSSASSLSASTSSPPASASIISRSSSQPDSCCSPVRYWYVTHASASELIALTTPSSTLSTAVCMPLRRAARFFTPERCFMLPAKAV